MSVWQLAQDRLTQQTKAKMESMAALGPSDEELSREDSHILVLGSKNTGKTSLILRFLDRDEQVKPTIALEYTYGRRTKGNAKEVGHIWELGGGPQLLELIDVPISTRTIEHMSVVIMVDLSRPEQIWSTLEASLASLRTRIEKLFQELGPLMPDLKQKLMKKVWERIGVDHADKQFMDPLPLPLAIVGGKFDLFQDFEPEQKKVMVKALRFIAHTNGAMLQFFSTKIESLVTRGRSMFGHMVFGTTLAKGMSSDYSKPIFIPVGSDSLQEIGPPSASSDIGSPARTPLDLWRNAFCATFPQKSTHIVIRDDPAKDAQFKEDSIIALREQKDKELEKYVKMKAREQTLGLEITVQQD